MGWSLRNTAGDGCSVCGGQGVTTYAYLQSTYADNYNAWHSVTVQNQSGVRTATFTNFASQPMLVVTEEAATGKRWYEYTRYDDAGQPVLATGTSGIQDDHIGLLAGSLSGLASLPANLIGTVGADDDVALDLNQTSGLFQLSTYYPATDATASGRLASTYLRQGERGGDTSSHGYDVQQDAYVYERHTAPGY